MWRHQQYTDVVGVSGGSLTQAQAAAAAVFLTAAAAVQRVQPAARHSQGKKGPQVRQKTSSVRTAAAANEIFSETVIDWQQQPQSDITYFCQQ